MPHPHMTGDPERDLLNKLYAELERLNAEIDGLRAMHPHDANARFQATYHLSVHRLEILGHIRQVWVDQYHRTGTYG